MQNEINEIIAVASVRNGMNANDNYEIVSYIDNTYQAFRNGKVIGPRTKHRPLDCNVIDGFIHKPLDIQKGEVSRTEKLPYIQVVYNDNTARVFKNGAPFGSRFPYKVGQRTYLEWGLWIDA